MLSCLLKQDWHGAAAAMLNSKWAQQVGQHADNPGAIIRDGSVKLCV